MKYLGITGGDQFRLKSFLPSKKRGISHKRFLLDAFMYRHNGIYNYIFERPLREKESAMCEYLFVAIVLLL